MAETKESADILERIDAGLAELRAALALFPNSELQGAIAAEIDLAEACKAEIMRLRNVPREPAAMANALIADRIRSRPAPASHATTPDEVGELIGRLDHSVTASDGIDISAETIRQAAASLRSLQAERDELRSIALDALASFRCTQNPSLYPADHWSRRARSLVSEDK
jgi:hypothetical protein